MRYCLSMLTKNRANAAMPSPSARASGAMGRAHGAVWEAYLESLFRVEGAAFWHLHPEAKKTSHGIVYAAEGPPDYLIAWQGHHLLCEAKSTSDARFKLSMIQPHQARSLSTWEEQGGLSVLLVRMGGEGWAVPWRDVRPLFERWSRGDAERGEASLSAGWFRERGEPVGVRVGWLGRLVERAGRE